MTPALPRRPWFRFSLRTLFVAVAVAALLIGWLRWNWQVTQERVMLRKWIYHGRGSYATVAEWEKTLPGPPGYVAELGLPGPVDIPLVRKCFGDEGVVTIQILPWKVTDAEVAHIKEVFPEATVELVPEEKGFF